METISVPLPKKNSRRRILFAMGIVVYLIALYSLLTSFYIFEIRPSNVRTEVNPSKQTSVTVSPPESGKQEASAVARG